MSAKSRKNVGKVRKRSINTTMLLSTTPLKYPALTPTISPTKLAINALITPIIKETCPPCISLAKRSRPSLSVPKICSNDGGKSMASGFNS